MKSDEDRIIISLSNFHAKKKHQKLEAEFSLNCSDHEHDQVIEWNTFVKTIKHGEVKVRVEFRYKVRRKKEKEKEKERRRERRESREQ